MVRLLILTSSISHFEAPLFRLAAATPDLELLVLHQRKASQIRYDTEYQSEITWGADLTSGYESRWTPNTDDAKRIAAIWQPDVTLCYGYLGKFVRSVASPLRAAGGRLIHRGTLTPQLDPRAPIRGRLRQFIRPFILRRFDAHHYGGAYSLEVLIAAGIPSDRCYFVPYAVDADLFVHAADHPAEQSAAERLRQSLGWEKANVLLFIAQHNWFKGPDLAVQIAATMQRSDPLVRLLVVGSGRMTDMLRRRCAESLQQGTFHFTGFVPSLQTPRFYLASDLVIFPSRYETWARAVNEAMTLRRPCLVSPRVAAIGGLVEPDNGVLARFGARPFAEAAQRFFRLRTADRTRMGEAARAKALTYTYHAHADAFRRSVFDTAAIQPLDGSTRVRSWL